MSGRPHTSGARLLAVAVIGALGLTPGCEFAVKHPAITAGAIGGTLGFTTCKLASDDYRACFLIGGGAAAFLGLVAATAIWLGGDGHSAAVEEQAQPLPEDGPPRKRRRIAPDEPASPTPGNATPGNATPGNATPGNATPGNATPASPTPGSSTPRSSTPRSSTRGNLMPASPSSAGPS